MFQWGKPQADTKQVESFRGLYLERWSAEVLQYVYRHLKVFCFLFLSVWLPNAAKPVVSCLIQFLLSTIRSGFVSMSRPLKQSESIWIKAATHTVVLHRPSDWIGLVFFTELSNVAAPQNTLNRISAAFCSLKVEHFVLLTSGLPKNIRRVKQAVC